MVSVAAMLALNFFFRPPVGTFTIADPQNWIALLAFLVVSVIASNLSAAASSRRYGTQRCRSYSSASPRIERFDVRSAQE